jgi:hypothetical protein
MEKELTSKVDQMTGLKRSAKPWILQSPPQDREDYLVSIFHFETALEGTFIYRMIAKNICDGVSHVICARSLLIDLW